MSDIATKIDELIALLERQNDRDRAAIAALHKGGQP